MPGKIMTDAIRPDFARGGGLVAAVAQDARTLEVLMLAWMDERAWERTLATGEVHYYSRSRKALWRKGESSGHVQKLKSVRVDCDRDAVLLLVEQVGGAACHEGYVSCFYREITGTGVVLCSPKVFDPEEVYK